MTKCTICERRPARDGGFCANCSSKLEAERGRKANNKPKYYLTYQGHVVGLFPNGDGMLKAQLLKRNPDKLPKRSTHDLNHYIQGFSREQIKRFKACVLKLAHA